MGFEVIVPGTIEKQISDWNLPEKLIESVYERLTNELAKRPFEVLRTVRAPVRGLHYSFVENYENQRYTFVFSVSANEDDHTLVIRDCWHPVVKKVATGRTLPVVADDDDE